MRKHRLILIVLGIALLVLPLAAQADVVNSGSCGENITWTLDSEGLLTISGSGDMANYTYSSKSPWDSVKGSIKEVVINEGVTSIGSYAFYFCGTQLQKITLPSTVKAIGSNAIIGNGLQAIAVSSNNENYCSIDGVLYDKNKTALIRCPEQKTTISIPDTVTTIGECAFYSCKQITEVHLPESVTSICNSAFGNCEKLSSINLTDHITRLEGYSFNCCSSLKEINIPKKITKIFSATFSQCSFSSVVIPSNITEIGSNNFAYCSSLTSITIPASVKTIGAYTFDGHNENLVIDCHPGSAAEKYAIEKGIHYSTQGHDQITDEAVSPTCTTTGLTAGTHCSVCGVITPQEVIPVHHEAAVKEAVEATCTETGLTEGTYCKLCGVVLTAQEVIPALGHLEAATPAVAATCSQAGLTEGVHCERCNAVLVAQEEVQKLPHTEVIDTAVAPTCTETGLTEGKHCSVCGEILLAQEIIPATGHEEEIDPAVEATCTETGLTEGAHCSVCGEILVAQEVVSKTDHTGVIDPAVEPTCTETGLTEGKHCAVCGAVLVEQKEIPALGHDWVLEKETRAPTLETAGEALYVCSRNNEHTSIREVPSFIDSSIPGKWVLSEVTSLTGSFTLNRNQMYALNGVDKIMNFTDNRWVTITSWKNNKKDTELQLLYARKGTLLITATLEMNQYTKEIKEKLVDKYTITEDGMIGTEGKVQVKYVPEALADKLITNPEIVGKWKIDRVQNPDGSIGYLDVLVATGMDYFVITLYNNGIAEINRNGELVQLPYYGRGNNAIEISDKIYIQDGKTLWVETEGVNLFFIPLEDPYTLPSEDTYHYPPMGITNIDLGKSGWVQNRDGSYSYGDASHKAVSGYRIIGGTPYCFNDHGIMLTGWGKVGGSWYFADSSGALYHNGWNSINGSWYYFNADATMATGWKQINGIWYYFDANGTMVTGTQVIDGTTYTFDGSGAWIENTTPAQTGWVQDGGSWFYYDANGAKATGWLQDGAWYYFNGSGVMQTGWQKIGGTWYYFNAGGAMKTGWLQDGATWYWFDGSGAMATGTRTIDGTGYTFDASGAWIENAAPAQNGWVQENGSWTYYDANGAKVTGWLQDGAWYYFNDSGIMITGWKAVGGSWYYFKSSGAMVTGWQKIGGSWYFFRSSGAMKTGWYEDKDGSGKSTWYWFDKDGAMATGWKEINGQWEMFADSGAWLYTWDGNPIIATD